MEKSGDTRSETPLAAQYAFGHMVGLDRIERSCLIAFINSLRAIFERDDDRLIIRPRMPGLVNGHCALGTRYANLPWNFGVDRTMELRRKVPIIKLCARFGINMRGCQARLTRKRCRLSQQTARRSADKYQYQECRPARSRL